MKKSLLLLCAGFAALTQACSGSQESATLTPAAENALRAPAAPLVTIDPYTSAWSMTDNLYDDCVRHWSGREFPCLALSASTALSIASWAPKK